MKKLNELKNGKTKEEMDAAAYEVFREVADEAEVWRHKMVNDPLVLACRAEYERRKLNGDFSDEA